LRALFDYLFATSIMVIMFISATASYISMITVPEKEVSQEQLLSTAEKVMDQLLLTEGTPADWGVRTSVPSSIGLAGRNGSEYQLDLDKVRRLTDNTIGTMLSTQNIYQLLGLNKNYAFRLMITPALNITVVPTQFILVGSKNFSCAFNVTVRTHENIPVPNANLTASLLLAYVQTGMSPNFDVAYYMSDAKYNVTDWKGRRSFDYTSFMQGLSTKDLTGCVFFVTANFYGLQSLGSYVCTTGGDTTFAQMVGNDVLIGITVDSMPKGAKHLRKQASEITVDEGAAQAGPSDFVLSQYNDKGVVNYGSKDFRVFQMSYVEPGTIYTVMVVKSEGKNILVICSTIPTLQPVGSKLPTGTVMVYVRRLVYMGGMSYYIELHLWKMSD